MRLSSRSVRIVGRLLMPAMWLLVAAIPARAATPLGTAWTYQGRLQQSGVVVNDTCDCQFSLWDDPTAGAQVGPTLTFNGVGGNPPPIAVADGLLAAELDFGAAAFNGQARWLQIAVACPSGGALTPLSPRQPLNAAPYALYALDGPGGAGGFWAASGAHIRNTNAGRVGIGTDAPEAPLHVFAGSAGAVTAHSNSIAAFERSGNGYLSILTPNANERGLLFGDPSSFVNGGIIYNSGSVPNGFQFRTAVNTTRMVITEPGNVGIGTAAPASFARLHVLSANTGVINAVRGETASTSGTGVVGYASATSGLAVGVAGDTTSTSGVGVMGSASVATGECYGVWGINFSTGGRAVYGQSLPGSGTNYGVYGTVAGGSGAGVYGENTGGGSAPGVSGVNLGVNGAGVRGVGARVGVVGDAGSATASGVSGSSIFPDGVGVFGINEPAMGNGSGIGVYGQTNAVFGVGVYGVGTHPVGQPIGVYGTTLTGFGYGVYSAGNLGASGTKSFVIDHPADPENKYLRHYSAEGPEPLNAYSGVAVLDDSGAVRVELPEYFATINRDPRIQLTAVGAPMPMLHVAEEIDADALAEGAKAGPGRAVPRCSFRIAGGVPGAKVSWRVEAVRNDPWVRSRGAPVAVAKSDEERGRFQHPELYGQPAERGIHYRPAEAEAFTARAMPDASAPETVLESSETMESSGHRPEGS